MTCCQLEVKAKELCTLLQITTVLGGESHGPCHYVHVEELSALRKVPGERELAISCTAAEPGSGLGVHLHTELLRGWWRRRAQWSLRLLGSLCMYLGQGGSSG
jgi:hypothetical protein